VACKKHNISQLDVIRLRAIQHQFILGMTDTSPS